MKIQQLTYFLFAMSCGLLWSGCSIFDKAEEIPSYLYIQPFQLNTNNNIQGSNLHQIKDAWVSVDGQFIGVFPVPALVPVLATGTQEVTIFAGIKEGALASAREINPMFTKYVVSVNLAATEVDTLKPVVTYDSDAIFLVNETFETSNSITDDLDGNIETKVITSTEDVYEGNKSGKIVLEDGNDLLEVGTNLFYEMPGNIRHVYLELDYKNDVDLQIGVKGQSSFTSEEIYKIGLYPTDDWTKLYLDITDEINTLIFNGAEEFQIIFQAFNSTGEPVYIYLDNFKLMYF